MKGVWIVTFDVLDHLDEFNLSGLNPVGYLNKDVNLLEVMTPRLVIEADMCFCILRINITILCTIQLVVATR